MNVNLLINRHNGLIKKISVHYLNMFIKMMHIALINSLKIVFSKTKRFFSMKTSEYESVWIVRREALNYETGGFVQN